MHLHANEVTLGLAFFLGALHAIEPGHGKTAMLVYLSGERRSFWHPVVIGIGTKPFSRSNRLQRLPWPHIRAAIILAIGFFYLARLIAL